MRCLILFCAAISLRAAPQAKPVSNASLAAWQVKSTIRGAEVFHCAGQSMLPLYNNTFVVTEPVEYSKIKKGDILAYRRRDGRVFIHAVIGEDGRGYIVKGINNKEADVESVNETNLIGRVIAAFKNENQRN